MMLTPTSNIFLVGLMGSGKTTIGRALAKRLNLRFIDADHEIEARTGATIPLIFEIEGEASFRQRCDEIIDPDPIRSERPGDHGSRDVGRNRKIILRIARGSGLDCDEFAHVAAPFASRCSIKLRVSLYICFKAKLQT